MDMSGGEMPAGSMSMGGGVPGLFYLQQMYWAVIGAAIAFAAAINVVNKFLNYQRKRSKCSKPKTIFFLTYATATALAREIAYATPAPFSFKNLIIRFPPLGRVILVLSNLVVLMVFCFYKLNTADQWSWEDIGYRTGFMSVAQLPLIFLLAGKKNIIGALTGFGYERLNWLHRWTARILWLTTTIHMGFWFRSWARYDYITVKLTTDPITQRGFAAWCILAFIVCSSFAPVRKWNYELFVLQHLVMFIGFTAAVWIHIPNEVKAWVSIPIGLFAFDSLMRAIRVLYSNLTILHWKLSKEERSKKGIWANRATLKSLPGNVTRITIEKPVISWKPGQHVLLSCHSIVPLQSHPFTISSIESDEKMEFLVRAGQGGTKRIFDHASKIGTLPVTSGAQTKETKIVAIDGPYGRIRPLGQFDSVVFIAGSTGATFTVPLMRDIVKDWQRQTGKYYGAQPSFATTRRIRFVWVIKSRDQASWFCEQLERAVEQVDWFRSAYNLVDKEIDISIYITCDEALSTEKPQAVSNCQSSAHGPIKEIGSTGSVDETAEKDQKEETISIHSITSSAANPRSSSGNGCGTNGTCCCRATVKDEADAPVCCCSGPPPTDAAQAPLPKEKGMESERTGMLSSSSLKILSGRPHPRSIIRKVLEQAEGESAVVVCGPRGLSDDVRNSVVALSDERAVHKGTGAQGIYLHVEGFDY